MTEVLRDIVKNHQLTFTFELFVDRKMFKIVSYAQLMELKHTNLSLNIWVLNTIVKFGLS